MLDLVRGEHASLLVRSERPHQPEAPVPESLLRLKAFYSLGNKYIIHIESEKEKLQ